MSCNTPDGVSFHKDHLWVQPVAHSREVLVGLSDFAQKQLGNILFVELPRIGDQVSLGQPCGTVESYKVVSELVAPVSGEVVETNGELKRAARLINEDCYGTGWLLRIRLSEPEHLSTLLAADAYLRWIGDRMK